MAQDGSAQAPGTGPPTWNSPREALTVCRYPSHLRRTLTTAAIVGTLLFGLNQADVVLRDGWSIGLGIKAILNYLVPFCVANVGILSACRRRPEQGPRSSHRTVRGQNRR